MSLFITIEGLDGSGTTTQAGLLTQHLCLMNHRAFLTYEPSKGRIGKLIREILSREDGLRDPVPNQRTLALLFAADRRDHLHRVIEPALAKKQHVVCARYLHSSLAYQGFDDEAERWVRELNLGVRIPDLVFFLDVPPETCLERIRARDAETQIFENLETLRTVYSRYRQMAHTGELEVVPGTESETEVAAHIAGIVDYRIRT